jgi:hypothetical protein
VLKGGWVDELSLRDWLKHSSAVNGEWNYGAEDQDNFLRSIASDTYSKEHGLVAQRLVKLALHCNRAFLSLDWRDSNNSKTEKIKEIL